jgi:hypothetical protein
MRTMDWVRSVKGDLLRLQRDTGIPALFSAAQMCHESNSGGKLSRLARDHHNYAGLKAAKWQREYGCGSVVMGTWEVLDGQRVDLDDAFCSCPSWEVWLKVYASLLTGKFYGGAMEYRYDPLLYGVEVWRKGWATDPAYVFSLAHWMRELMPIYGDTITGAPFVPKGQALPVRLPTGRTIYGILHGNTTYVEAGGEWVRLRAPAELLGATVEWLGIEQGVNVTVEGKG